MQIIDSSSCNYVVASNPHMKNEILTMDFEVPSYTLFAITV